MTLRDTVSQGALAARAALGLPASVRDAALAAIGKALDLHRPAIAEANESDLAQAREAGLPSPILKRLAFDDKKLDDALSGIDALRTMADPVGRVLESRLLDEGLTLTRVSCPIGLIAMIFESRPDALVQMAALAARSGNAIVLKGGREARHSNRVLAEIICRAGEEAGLPAGWLSSLESREEVQELLAMDDLVDLVIPRGSKEFVARIMETSRIPVLGHSDGVCHVYVHQDADPSVAIPVVVDSKIQYPAACNAAEVLVADSALPEDQFVNLLSALIDKGVRLELCERSLDRLNGVAGSSTSSPEDRLLAGNLAASGLTSRFSGSSWSVEYLDMRMAVVTVDGLEEAISHINRYGSGHTDCIVTRSPEAAERFMDAVDSASVYWNASTRFADGYRYGLGAEVGIATGKLHARGPMGVQGLLTYKWKLKGKGQIVADYASGKAAFVHKDLPV